jgi:cytochrome d ubiquinol oxidase subunit I
MRRASAQPIVEHGERESNGPGDVSALDLARLQFGIVTVFHFLIVPTSIGLAVMVAYLQTRHHRTGDEVYLRASQYWGKFFLVSFAVGVATGIFQEFQFGMNWSQYSRYVGDVFGAPLAMEGLGAFFLESIFIGVWMFGRGRVSARVHLASIWLVVLGTLLSSCFILAANSWMQHPVGYRIDPATGHAQLTSIFAVFTNSTFLYAFPHTVLGALVTGGTVVLGVSCWHLLRGKHTDVASRCARIGLVVTLCAALGAAFVGDSLGKLLEEQQPMKMASAEALYNTAQPADLSLIAIAGFKKDPGKNAFDLNIPHGLSIMSGGWNKKVRGINDVQREYQKRYGPGDYVPVVGVTFWTFRLMVGSAGLLIILAALGLFLVRKRKLESSRWFLWAAVGAIALPYVANSAGWIFTEMGRQPWVVQGLLLTKNAVSPSTTVAEVLLSLIGFVVLYAILGAAMTRLFVRFIKDGPKPAVTETAKPDLALAY